MNRPLAVLLIATIFFSIGRSQNLRFQVDVVAHLNTSPEFLFESDTLWAATYGGLLKYDLIADQYQVFNSADGIWDHDLTSLALDSRRIFAMGSIHGNLSFLDTRDGSILNDQNLIGNEIVELEVVADTLWVLTKKFVSVYLFNEPLNRYQFRESYQEFDANINEFFAAGLAKNQIWLASDIGLLHAPSDFLRNNLYASSNWRILDTDDGLLNSRIHDLTASADGEALYLATANGLSVYDFSSFENISSGLIDKNLLKIKRVDDLYYAATDDRISRFDEGVFVELNEVDYADILDLAVRPSTGEIWFSTESRGIRNFSADATLYLDSPLSSHVAEMLLDANGNLWCTANLPTDELKLGVFVRTADGWRNFVFGGGTDNNYRFLNSTMTLYQDSEQNVWVGSWGGGIAIFDTDFNVSIMNLVDDPGFVWERSILADDTSGVAATPAYLSAFSTPDDNIQDYTVITDIMQSPDGESIYLLNNAAQSNQGIIRFNATSFADDVQLDYFTNPYFNRDWWEMTTDIFGDIWLLAGGNSRAAVRAQISGNQITPLREYTETGDNIKSNLSQSIAADADGYVWVGTKSGLSGILDGTVFDFRETYQPIGLTINDIFVDSQNNKWFATDKGLSILLASGSPFEPESWVHIVPPNSTLDPIQLFEWPNVFTANLPAEELHSVLLDENTGDVYIGSAAGITIIRGNPIASAFQTYDNVKAGPNPLIIGNGQNNVFSIFNLTARSEVKILSPNGQLIRTLDPGRFSEVQGSGAQWDGRNMDGRHVSTGVYLYYVTNESGQQASGKVLVVNQPR